MKKLNKILENVKNGTISVEQAEQRVMSLFGVSASLPAEEEQPVLVGTLNRVFGFNGYKKVEVGAYVFSYKDRYYFEMIPLNGGKPFKQTYYKHSLEPFIDFIGNEH